MKLPLASFWFQSTRPHGARRAWSGAGRRGWSVSIHAPARGATGAHHCDTQTHNVSIHAPARGATQRQGCPIERVLVSIHAPARGATRLARRFLACPAVSIHAPARGATRLAHLLVVVEHSFQSTRPHGARRDDVLQGRACRCFNPRARTGRDTTAQRHGPVEPCFNPRARTGRDRLELARPQAGVVSIHAPARGARPGRSRPVMSSRFQSTRPHGARAPAVAGCRPMPGFNPRARTGRDWDARIHSTPASFNPRARTGREGYL